MRGSVAERFWRRVEKGDGCWNWIGAGNGKGYGHLYKHGRMQYAHRISWEMHCGPIPTGLFVLHKCDNRACVRPGHLFVGTQCDNIRDCVAKGRLGHRRARGEHHSRARLTEAQVVAIRGDARLQKQIALEYGIKQALISKIKLRLVWRHLP